MMRRFEYVDEDISEFYLDLPLFSSELIELLFPDLGGSNKTSDELLIEWYNRGYIGSNVEVTNPEKNVYISRHYFDSEEIKVKVMMLL